MSATSVAVAPSRGRHGVPHVLALLLASLSTHRMGIALTAVAACIPLLPMPWTIRAAVIGLLPLLACWPKMMLLMAGARREALPSIQRHGVLAMGLLGGGGFATTWAIAHFAHGATLVACMLYSVLAGTYVMLWTIGLGSSLFVVLVVTIPALNRIAHEPWHAFADVSPHPGVVLVFSTVSALWIAWCMAVWRGKGRAYFVPCLVVLLLPLAAHVCLDAASDARAVFYYEYFFIPACAFVLFSLGYSEEPAGPDGSRRGAFLSVLEQVLYRRKRVPGEYGVRFGAEDESLWLPPRKRPLSASPAPLTAQAQDAALRACLGPPFAVHQGFRFDPSGLRHKSFMMATFWVFGPDELLGWPTLNVLLLPLIAMTLAERLTMYVERAQDVASGSENAELGLLPAWGDHAGIQSLLLPALAKPILQDAGLLFAAIVLFVAFLGADGGPALFVPTAIAMASGTAWLLAYVCAVLAKPRLADWPPQIVAAGTLAYGAGLGVLFGAGHFGTTASMAGAGLALAACLWAASRHLGARRPFFFR